MFTHVRTHTGGSNCTSAHKKIKSKPNSPGLSLPTHIFKNKFQTTRNIILAHFGGDQGEYFPHRTHF